MPTNAEVLSAMLSRFGVRRVLGAPLGPLEHRVVDDDDMAVLLADADGRVNGGWGAAFLDEQILHISSQPGGVAHPLTISSAAEFAGALLGAAGSVPATHAMFLDLDLEGPASVGADAFVEPPAVVPTLAPELADLSVVVLVGPGVARAGSDALAGLDAFARHSGRAVANTFGAKGVFRWDSPFHAGTVGLQRDDLALAGLLDADLVIVSGLDPSEVDSADLEAALVVDVDPRHFGALGAHWPDATGIDNERSALYTRIAAAVTPLYENGSAPLNPARAALHLSGAASATGVVVADSGPAGFWIGRAFPTGTVDSVVVCAVPIEGSAVAGAIVAGWDGRPSVAVTHEMGPMSEALFAMAERSGVAVGVQVWCQDGEVVDGERHAALCVDQFRGDATTIARLAIPTDVPASLVAAAGDVRSPFVAADR